MSTPRFRDGSVDLLPFTEVERGKAGTLLTLASIDRNGTVQDLRVIHRSGDEKMLSLTLEAVRAFGFEPARLGEQAVAVHFLYLFTTTEVRSKRIISPRSEIPRSGNIAQTRSRNGARPHERRYLGMHNV